MQNALEAEETRDDVLEGLLADRARAIETIWRRHYGPDSTAPRDYRLPMRSLMQTIRRPLTTHRAVRMLRIWAETVAAARKPWPERIPAVAAVATRSTTPDSASSELMLPGGVPPFALVTPRTVILDRCSTVAVAIERFRRDHAGALPDALPELVPDYLARVPMDPYTGGSLLYAKDDASYTIYSAGPDGKDDRGDLISELVEAKKRGYGPRPLRGRDAGVRVMIRR